jgi:Protein tyrosine and serine/threonine kinase
VEDTRPPALYYPYQPRLQQHRHRKPLSTGVSTGFDPTASASSINSGLQHRNYYLNQSGHAVAFKTPNPNRSTRGDSHSSLTPTQSTPIRETREIAIAQMAAPSPLAVNTSHHNLPIPSPPAFPHQTNMNARILSSASSFSSLEDVDACSFHNVDEELGGSSTHIRQDLSDSFKSHVLLSPGSEDNMARTSRRPLTAELYDQTPRVANTREIVPVPEHAALHIRHPTSNGSMNMSLNMTPRPKSPPTYLKVPFMPSLDTSLHVQPPPKSVNVEELQLFQLVESGTISHWEARVAEESRILQDQVYTNNDFSSSHSSASSEEAAANDPRLSIKHKRDNLTVATDSASSLQGAINFADLDLVEVIGGGGFGQVWKAVWRGTPVAVKVLTGSAQSRHVPRAVLEEFAAEINLLRGMRHPNICLYMGACVAPPNRAIITELAANGSLWDALRLPLTPPFVACDGLTRDAWPLRLYEPDPRHGSPPTNSWAPPMIPPQGTWPWVLVKRVACGAARGMAYLHSGKPPILHRDLKSANILLDESYTAKVCDFGLSRLKAHERSMTGNCGTVQWMAPEVLANQSYNEKADIFSYGVILWELLTRQCPYDGMSPIQCALSVLNRNQRPDIPKWCPQPMYALIRACVNREPDDRPSFEQIIKSLDAMP